MAKHMVKCPICGETFDANIVPFVKIKTRYAHEQCYLTAEQNKTQEQKEYDKLIAYIKQLFGIEVLTPKINKQIKDLVAKNYSYKGIRKTLVYWFDIKGESIEKANGGIGIVPFVYDKALTYWRSLWEAKERNKQVVIEEYILPTREVHIEPPQRQPMKHTRQLFTFLDEEVEGA